MFFLVVQRLLVSAVLDIFYFPAWWYGAGARHALFWCVDLLKKGNVVLAPGLWLKNIFVPMYGQYDFAGRMISFFMRSVQVFARTVALVLWLAVCLGLFIGWFIIPGVVAYGLIASILRLK